MLISASRKRFLAEAIGEEMRYDLPALYEATIAFNTLAASLGVHVVRVHDVEAHSRALRLEAATTALPHALADYSDRARRPRLELERLGEQLVRTQPGRQSRT